MNIFEFTDDNGVTYVVKGPTGSTQQQARQIFDTQKNTGSLVGLERGEVLNAVQQASKGLTSAGAQINSDALASTVSSATLKTNLSNVAVTNAINVGNFIKQGATNVNIGSLDASTVQGLLTQTVKQVGQSVNTVSNELGLGKFGLNARQLENQGIIKPGMTDLIAKNGNDLVSNLSSPTAWTGKMGINNITNLLDNGKVQNVIQENLMTSEFRSLTNSGAIQNLVSNKDIAAVINTATKFGTDSAVKLINGTLSKSVPDIANFAKSSEFGATFGAIAGKLGNPQSVISGITGNINSSLNQLTGNLTSGLPTGLNDLVGGLGKNLSGLTSGLSGQLTNLSAPLTGALSGVTGQLTGALSGVTGQLTGALSGVTGQLTGALSGSLGGLTAGLGGLGGLSVLGSFGGLGGGNPLQTGIKKAKAVFNTVNRKTVDASFNNIIGDNKVDIPDYGE